MREIPYVGLIDTEARSPLDPSSATESGRICGASGSVSARFSNLSMARSQNTVPSPISLGWTASLLLEIGYRLFQKRLEVRPRIGKQLLGDKRQGATVPSTSSR